MKKQLSLIILGLLLVSMIAFLPNIAHSYTPADYMASIIAAANRLVALQSVSPGPPADGGWDWIVTGLISHTASPSAYNLFGVTALGLIDAYELTGNASYLAAAKNTADFMKYGNPSAGDFYNGYGAYHWGYSYDYRFLMSYSAVSGDPSYKDYALLAWAWQKANIAAFANGDTIWAIYPDPGYAAWGTSDWGLATLRMGDTVWATNMATVMHNHIVEINASDPMAMGSTLRFLATIGGYAGDVTLLKDTLVALQELDGSWEFPGYPYPCTQSTAYAVIGLWAAGEYTAARKGADWLVSTQGTLVALPGGWPQTNYDPTYCETSETDSEPAQALSAAIASASVHDVAVTSVVAVVPHCSSKVGNDLWVFQGRPVYVNVTVLNKGDFDENVTVTLYYNITANQIIGAQNVTLSPGQNDTVSFVWGTTSVPYCHNYTITAVATIRLDNNPADNTLDNVYVKVRILGDLNGDGKVSGLDIALAAWSFGSYGPNCLYPGSPASPRWNLDADINGNNKIDGTDIAMITRNFGKSCSP